MPKLSSQDIADQKRALRKQMRGRRRALSKRQQQKAGRALAKRTPARLRWRGSVAAAYCASDGEIDTFELLKQLRQARKLVYLPFVDPSGRMRFIRCHNAQSRSQLVKGRWGIYHPPLRNARFAYRGQLKLVFVPLVAFDTNGKRLGRGGGFYDKLLANHSEHCHHVGLAHHFQCVDQLPIDHWDQPLDAVITDSRTHTRRQ